MAGRGTPQSRARQWLVVRKKSFHQEQGVEHDRFGEGNGQNRLDQYLRRGARISSHCIRGCHADQTNRHGCTDRCQTDVYVANHMLLPSFPRGHRGLNMFELLKNFYSWAVADPFSSC